MRLTKNPAKSKTIQGIVISVLPFMLPLVGIHTPAEINHVVQALGVIWAAYGRAVADGPLIGNR